MAIKIIKQGTKHLDTKKEITCNRCESVLEYNQKDTDFIFTKQETVLECPVCGDYIVIDTKVNLNE